MARVSVKATYALDLESIEALDRIARRWAVSKSEALRRAIHAAETADGAEGHHGLKQLDQLQQSLALSPAKTRSWMREIRAERRAGSPRGTRSRGR